VIFPQLFIMMRTYEMILWRRSVLTLIVSVAVLPAMAHAQRSYRAAPPEAVKLETKDGVGLSITYYASTAGKDATPVVMLHDYKDTQGMFSSFASRLQSPERDEGRPSFAVVTVNLRGHGDSTKQTFPDGTTREIDAAKLGRLDIVAMTLADMEAVRSFLVGENDDQKLNLNKLCLVGVGMGATVAVNWAAEDWRAPPLLVGKQGQDAKALVLVSPRWKYRGVPMQQALVQLAKPRIAWMLIYGSEDAATRADETRIYKRLDRFHPEPEPSQAARKPRDLFEMPLQSGLQGGRLLGQAGSQVEDAIIKFLTVHVAEQEMPWIKRRNRLD
jgi:pimeloyl-ACP methyl ester carboxylesterase